MNIYNFSAGPAILPQEVLEHVQKELLDYNNTGMSVMELSHRSELFGEILKNAEKLLRELMNIPDNYKVLFLQGGASTQFAMIPMNIAKGKKALYVNTGVWADKAIIEASKVDDVQVEVIASNKDEETRSIPFIDKNMIDQEAAYLHITTNETVDGIVFNKLPDTGNVPLVGDLSSNIMANNYSVKDFGLLYAGAQKNIGPSGLTLVIVREDLIDDSLQLPSMFNYSVLVKNNSMYNTPNTFAVYMAEQVFEWLKLNGGVAQMYKNDQEKAAILYRAIDKSDGFYTSKVKIDDRSITNIPFFTPNEDLDKKFIEEADARGFKNLKGHVSMGGMRASIYNAFPKEGVLALVEFMAEFQRKNS